MKRDIAIDGWWASEHPNPIFHDLTDKKIDAMYAKGGKDRQLAEWLRYEIVEQQKNPMAYFLGHGLPFSKKPRNASAPISCAVLANLSALVLGTVDMFAPLVSGTCHSCAAHYSP